MIDITGPTSRRERTFVGEECAVCEEPLEHILRGERILSLSCSHVAHEACFYEYIKEFESQDCPTCEAPLGIDPSRGCNLNFGEQHVMLVCPVYGTDLSAEKLNTLVRDMADLRDRKPSMPTGSDAPHYENRPVDSTQTHPDLAARSHDQLNQVYQAHERNQRLPTNSYDTRQHVRNDSGATSGPRSSRSREVLEVQQPQGRRHDYDLQAMEATIPTRHFPKNPIPTPTVTVRSEFPTLHRSRQQQSITCLVTVEVVDGNWRPNPEDIRNQTGSYPSETTDMTSRPPSQRRARAPDMPLEHPDVLARTSEDLRTRVDNWHGLDFARFGRLLLNGVIRVGKDQQSWQDLECYLFAEMLICVKERKIPSTQPWESIPETARSKTKCTLKGSILIKKHLKQIKCVPGKLSCTKACR